MKLLLLLVGLITAGYNLTQHNTIKTIHFSDKMLVEMKTGDTIVMIQTKNSNDCHAFMLNSVDFMHVDSKYLYIIK